MVLMCGCIGMAYVHVGIEVCAYCDVMVVRYWMGMVILLPDLLCDVLGWLIVYSEPGYLIVCMMWPIVWLYVYGARLSD